MSYRPSRGGYGNSQSGFRGSSRGGRGRGGFNDNYRGSNRGGGTYRGSRGSNSGNSGPWSSNYNSMNRNNETNWSPPPDNNFESRNRYSSDNERYSSNHNNFRRFKEGRRSERDSDGDGYLNTDEDYDHYGPGSSSYMGNRNSRSSYGPDTGSYRESSGSYRGRGSSRDYHSDFYKPHRPEDDYNSSPPRYSGLSYRGRGGGFRGGFRETNGPTSRGGGPGGYRGGSSYGNSEGMMKRKRHESPTSGWRPSSFRKEHDSFRGRIQRSNMHQLSDYRSRKIAEFREKTRQLRERLNTGSDEEEEEVEEVVDEEVEEEQSEEDHGKETAEEGELKSSEQPKKKRKTIKKIVKILKKVKKPKVKDVISKSVSTTKHSSKTKDQTTKRAGEHVRMLLCPHCGFTSVRTREYEMHLMKIRHRNAMTVIARNRKRDLFMIRQDQRKEQKEIDDNNDNDDSETTFCKLCQLTYKQPKGDHFASVLHKKIKQATQPSCSICRLVFASPMRLEHHLCSIDHLEKALNQPQQQPAAAEGPVPNAIDDAEGDVDMAKFMILDSIGSGEDEDKPKKPDSEKKKKLNSDKKLGIEFCKRVYYCELCDLKLPPHENVEQHCHNSLHVQRYAHHCEKTNKQQNVTEASSEQSCSQATKCELADSSDVDPLNKNVLHKAKPNKTKKEDINNDFDIWSSLDMVLEDIKENNNSDNEISSTAEAKNKF